LLKIVTAQNNGPDTAIATVSAWFNGLSLEAIDATGEIGNGEQRNFTFSFNPDTAGSNLVLNATISIG